MAKNKSKRTPPKKYSTKADRPKRRSYNQALKSHTRRILKFARESAKTDNLIAKQRRKAKKSK